MTCLAAIAMTVFTVLGLEHLLEFIEQPNVGDGLLGLLVFLPVALWIAVVIREEGGW